MEDVYPSVGMAGAFVCAPPFNNLINPQLRYECVAVEFLRGLVAEGQDPLEDIYIKYSLGIGQYQTDLERDIKILTLQAASGDIFKIPNSFILSLPDPNGVRYSLVMLGISLSAIPESVDLELIKNEVKELIFNRIGVRSEVKEMVYGASTLLTQSEHASIEAARLNNITNNNSNLKRVQELTLTVERLTQRLQMLESYIESKYLTP